MTPSEILKALSLGHECWPGDALEAASSQRSEVGCFCLKSWRKRLRKSRGSRRPDF